VYFFNLQITTCPKSFSDTVLAWLSKPF